MHHLGDSSLIAPPVFAYDQRYAATCRGREIGIFAIYQCCYQGTARSFRAQDGAFKDDIMMHFRKVRASAQKRFDGSPKLCLSECSRK